MVLVSFSGHCPFCGVESAFTPAPLTPVPLDNGYAAAIDVVKLTQIARGETLLCYVDPKGDGWWIAKCNACQRPVLARAGGDVVYPNILPKPVDARVPQPMLADLEQAKRCMAAESYDAAAILARRALQSLAVKQGAPRQALWKQLAWLQQNGKITELQRSSTEAARWLGNHGAHDNEPEVGEDGTPYVTEVDEADAEDAIVLVEQLCHSLYVQPAMSKRQLERRGKDDLGRPKKPS